MHSRNLFFLLPLLSACSGGSWPTDTSSPHDSDTGFGDSGTSSVIEARTIAALPWKPELLAKAGTSGAASQMGIWLNNPAGEGVTEAGQAHVYRVPWAPDGDDIQEASDITITAGIYDARIVGMDGSMLSVNSIDPISGNYEINRMSEPSDSGNLSDLVELKLIFDDSDSTYWNNIALMDADGDGSADDLVAAGHAGYGTNTGKLAVVYDAPIAGTLTSADMTMFDACEERSGSNVAFGAMVVIPDADGSLWVTCASSNRIGGYTEHRASLTSEPDALILGISGWSAAPDPRGGVWLGAEGVGKLVYASTDGTAERYAMDGFPLFGAAPAVAVVGDRIILAVGALGTYEAPASAVYVYEITGSTDLDALPYNRLEPEGDVLCLGGVNALVERQGGLYLGSSGFLLDSQEGCGIQQWEFGIAP